MNWEAIGAITGLVGIGLVIVSLMYVGIQVRQSNKESRSQSRQSLVNTFGLLNWELATHPELLVIVGKGVDKRTSLSNLDKTRFENVMGRYLWNLHLGILQLEDGTLDPGTLDIIGNQMLMTVLMPGGKEWLEQTVNATPEVKRYIARRMNDPDSLPLPASEATPYWVGLTEETQT